MIAETVYGKTESTHVRALKLRLHMQEERSNEAAQDASPSVGGRRLSPDDALRVRRRNHELLMRRRSCADAAAEREAAQRAHMERLAQQVQADLACFCASCHLQ